MYNLSVSFYWELDRKSGRLVRGLKGKPLGLNGQPRGLDDQSRVHKAGQGSRGAARWPSIKSWKSARGLNVRGLTSVRGQEGQLGGFRRLARGSGRPAGGSGVSVRVLKGQSRIKLASQGVWRVSGRARGRTRHISYTVKWKFDWIRSLGIQSSANKGRKRWRMSSKVLIDRKIVSP